MKINWGFFKADEFLKQIYRGLKNPLLYPILGSAIASWGGGMLFVGFMIGDTNPINTVNAFGLILAGLGLAITIKSLSVLKKYVSVVEE
jgi:hypothetical protein